MNKNVSILLISLFIITSLTGVVYAIYGGTRSEIAHGAYGFISSPADSSYMWIGTDPTATRPTLDLLFVSRFTGSNFTTNATWVMRRSSGVNFTLAQLFNVSAAGTNIGNLTNITNFRTIPSLPQGSYNLTLNVSNTTLGT